MKLIIVESPTKAKTISKFLGPRYRVLSSYGHMRDLPKTTMGIDIEKNFEPKYVVNAKVRDKVKLLKAEAKKADEIILATDEDREGEAIAWHLGEILGVKPDQKNRIVFHEITKKAISHAIENPRSINFHLVDAQQGRRVLDRLVGYELSPFLWKKIKKGLSAGRVQSIALRFIVEREREIESFKKEEYWVISAKVRPSGSPKVEPLPTFDAILTAKNGKKIEEARTLELFAGKYKTRISLLRDEKSAHAAANEIREASLKITDITKKEIKRTPPPPFTTSTLQQAAITQLGMSAKAAMMHAQKLYEKGFITYMRTDSVNLSLESLIAARKFIENKFGKDFALSQPRFFKTKSRGAQEAHEAIRPTDPGAEPEMLEAKLEGGEFRLYRMIWKRMVACQMKEAILDSQKITILASHAASKNEYVLEASGLKVKFPGYYAVLGEKAMAAETVLPPLEKNEKLKALEVKPEQKFTSPPPRYTEASLVKVLEENGIGRPSTYAPTISTIIDRKYVEKNEEKKLAPLEIGFLVSDLLKEHFPDIIDITFTARMEEDLDLVAEGKKEWRPLIKIFYEPFHKNLEAKTKEVKKEDVLEKLDRKCPECGGDLLVRFGRFGKFIACNKYPECKYTEKTEEDKAEDAKHSGEKCEKCGSPMVVKRGRFGAFLGCSKYPECKNIKSIAKSTGVKCPKCKEGDILERKSKRGRIFYGCSKYPACDFSLWSKPTGEPCPKCQNPLVFQAKGKIKCSSKECDFEKEQ